MKGVAKVKPSLVTAVVTQALTGAVTATITDGGVLLSCWLYAMAAYWIGFAVARLRRGKEPSADGVLFIKWSFMPLLLVAIMLSTMVRGW